ncbi:protease modulator HflK family protein [bacterium]|nr:protease modulator HflK family protein [candidate division CSSED10-310 bacterium]
MMRKKEKAIIIVAVSDLMVTALKFVLAVFTGSLALLADAWHSFGDLATSLIVFVSLLIDRKTEDQTLQMPNENKPVIIRRGNWELRVSLLIGIVLIIIAGNVLKKSITGSDFKDISYPGIASLFVLVLMLVSYLRFKFELSVGEETQSPALIADSYHSKVDIYILGLVLISLCAEYINLPLDRWAAAVIGLLILSVASQIFYRALRQLLKTSQDTAPEMRCMEDNLILLLLGGISQSKYRIKEFLIRFEIFSDQKLLIKWTRRLVIILIGLSLAVYLCSGFYVVNSNERAIVECFKVPINIKSPTGPGLHYFFPSPIGRIKKVDIETIHRKQIGYQSSERKEYIFWTNVHYIREYSMLTGDNTFLDIAANLHYRIKDPAAYLYFSSDPLTVLETLTYQTLMNIIGQGEFFDMITFWRDEMEDQVREDIQESCDRFNLGIEVVDVFLRDMHPPVDVAPSFEDVVSAQEDLETFTEEAIGYKKELLPLANSESTKLISEAEANRNNSVLLATAKANVFKSLEYAFQKNRNVNKIRVRLETLETALYNIPKIVIDSNNNRYPVDVFLDTTGSMNASMVQTSGEDAGGEF